MNFLGMGPGELLLVMVLALIVFGPGKLPEIGQGLGRAIREFRRATDSITQEFNRELTLDALIQPDQPQGQSTSPAVAEEARPMATPVVEEAPSSETVIPRNGYSMRPAVIARKRFRRMKRAAALTETTTPAQRIRKLRATKATAAAPGVVAVSEQPETVEVVAASDQPEAAGV